MKTDDTKSSISSARISRRPKIRIIAESERFEKEWIAALQRHADEPEHADKWVSVQAWGAK